MTHAERDHGPDRVAEPEIRAVWRPSSLEPPLDDILSDPLVRLLMLSDHLDPDEVRRFFDATAALIRSGSGAPAAFPQTHPPGTP